MAGVTPLPGSDRCTHSSTTHAQGLLFNSKELPLENQILASLLCMCFYSFLGKKNLPAYLKALIAPVKGPAR